MKSDPRRAFTEFSQNFRTVMTPAKVRGAGLPPVDCTGVDEMANEKEEAAKDALLGEIQRQITEGNNTPERVQQLATAFALTVGASRGRLPGNFITGS